MWWKKKQYIFQNMQHQLRSRFLAESVRVQRRAANYLQRKDSKLTPRQRKAYFFVFVGLACGTCTYILADTLFGQKDHPVVTIQPLPAPVVHPFSDVPRFSRSDTATMLQFRILLDSLRETPEGRAKLEKYLAGRPGFLDSFENAEKKFR